MYYACVSGQRTREWGGYVGVLFCTRAYAVLVYFLCLCKSVVCVCVGGGGGFLYACCVGARQ